MSGIATSLSRYTPISNSPFSHSLNLGARFLLGGRIVTPASRTVRAGPVDSPPGNAQIFIWMVVGPTCHSSLPPHFVQSRAELERLRRRRPLPSISRAGTFLGTSSTFPNPLTGFLRLESSPATAGHHGRCLKLCSTVDPPLRSSSARTDRGSGFMVSSLCSPVFFPFHGVSSAPVNGRRRRRRACCCLGRG